MSLRGISTSNHEESRAECRSKHEAMLGSTLEEMEGGPQYNEHGKSVSQMRE